MRDVIKFGKTVTFEKLNPHNFHLKNDYINNILFVALSTFPLLESLGYELEVKQAFVSNAYMDANPELLDERMPGKYSQGLGLKLGIKDYDHYALLEDLPVAILQMKSKVHCYIDKQRKLVELFFEMEESKVYEVIGSEERRIS